MPCIPRKRGCEEGTAESPISEQPIGASIFSANASNSSEAPPEMMMVFREENPLPNTPLPVFTETMRRMIGTLREHGVKPVLSTLPPISSERYLDWITRDGLSKENILTWLSDANAIYRYQEKYSLAIERLAAETGCSLVDLRSAFLEKRALLPYLCADGIHPSDLGQRLIHKVLSEAADALPAFI